MTSSWWFCRRIIVDVYNTSSIENNFICFYVSCGISNKNTIVHQTPVTNTFILIWISGHYGDVIMGTMASQITSLTIVYSTVYSDADQRKHQRSASLAFVRWIHLGPVNSPHKWPVTRKMFPFDDVIMVYVCTSLCCKLNHMICGNTAVCE